MRRLLFAVLALPIVCLVAGSLTGCASWLAASPPSATEERIARDRLDADYTAYEVAVRSLAAARRAKAFDDVAYDLALSAARRVLKALDARKAAIDAKSADAPFSDRRKAEAEYGEAANDLAVWQAHGKRATTRPSATPGVVPPDAPAAEPVPADVTPEMFPAG